MSDKRFCGPLFPGVYYTPMKSNDLKKFVIDIQTFGFTPWRKMRLLQAVGRFCTAAAVPYVLKYKSEYSEFTGAAWVAIHQAINHYSKDLDGGFLTLLAFWIKSEYNNVIYRDYLGKKYSQDPGVILESIYKPVAGDPGNEILLIDTIKDPASMAPAGKIQNKLFIDKLTEKANLSKKEKCVLNESFGLSGNPLSMAQIGYKLKCSRERVRQIKNNALKRIQNKVKKDKELC